MIIKFRNVVLLAFGIFCCLGFSTTAHAGPDDDRDGGGVKAYRFSLITLIFNVGPEGERDSLNPDEIKIHKITVVEAPPTEEDQLLKNSQRKNNLQATLDNAQAICLALAAIETLALQLVCAGIGLIPGAQGVAIVCTFVAGAIGVAMVAACIVAKNNGQNALDNWKLAADNAAKALWNDAQRQQAINAALADLDAIIPC